MVKEKCCRSSTNFLIMFSGLAADAGGKPARWLAFGWPGRGPRRGRGGRAAGWLLAGPAVGRGAGTAGGRGNRVMEKKSGGQPDVPGGGRAGQVALTWPGCV